MVSLAYLSFIKKKTSLLHKLFQKKEEQETLPSQHFSNTITKQRQYKKKILQTNLSHEHTMQKSLAKY